MRTWHERDPTLVEQIRDDLRARQPNLHLFIGANAGAVIKGTFAVRSPAGAVLDRFQIVIELFDDHSRSLPIVREVGGRIPWREDFHVERDGRACVLLPDDRWRCFPEGAPLRQFLDGPLHDYFLGQSLVALGEDWPFGGWGHGAEGIIQYYKQLLETDDPKTILRFLQVMAKLNLKLHLPCPCGSGNKIKKCCTARVIEMRRRIPPAIARKSLERLSGRSVPETRAQGGHLSAGDDRKG